MARIQDSLKGKNKTYKNEIVEFHRGGIESKNEYSFIPFASITRVSLGQLPPTITSKTILGVVIAVVGLLFFITAKWWGFLLGIAAIIVGVVIVLRSWKSWYALNIDMASSAVYSFIADNKNYVDKGYRLLLHEINEREENRGGNTYNFGNGNTINGHVGDKINS